jgi:hypothetical protein
VRCERPDVRTSGCHRYCPDPRDPSHRYAAGQRPIVLVLLFFQPGDQPVEAMVATPLSQPGCHAVRTGRSQRARHRGAHHGSEEHHRGKHHQRQPAPPSPKGSARRLS